MWLATMKMILKTVSRPQRLVNFEFVYVALAKLKVVMFIFWFWEEIVHAL